jgi:hypothetical protein
MRALDLPFLGRRLVLGAEMGLCAAGEGRFVLALPGGRLGIVSSRPTLGVRWDPVVEVDRGRGLLLMRFRLPRLRL